MRLANKKRDYICIYWLKTVFLKSDQVERRTYRRERREKEGKIMYDDCRTEVTKHKGR